MLLPFLLLGWAACEDASNVGIDLVDVQGGQPVVGILPPVLADEQIDDFTGNMERLLAGQVEDPLLGTIATTGYIDFSASFDITDSFRNGTVASASLTFIRDSYLYGDTTATVTLALREMPAEWSSALAPSDTVFPAGAVIHTVSFPASADTLTIDLPSAWVTANDATLRSVDFANLFHGFQLEAVSGNAVVGFAQVETRLLAVAGADTVSFTPVRTVTGIARNTPANLPPDRFLVQDGLGSALQLSVDLSADSLVNSALNRVVLRLPVDTLSLANSQAPLHFVRPRPSRIDLFGIQEDGEEVLLTLASVDAAGQLVFDTEAARAWLNALQQAVTGTPPYTRYRIAPPRAENSINALLLFQSTAGSPTPATILTYTPAN